MWLDGLWVQASKMIEEIQGNREFETFVQEVCVIATKMSKIEYNESSEQLFPCKRAPHSQIAPIALSSAMATGSCRMQARTPPNDPNQVEIGQPLSGYAMRHTISLKLARRVRRLHSNSAISIRGFAAKALAPLIVLS